MSTDKTQLESSIGLRPELKEDELMLKLYPIVIMGDTFVQDPLSMGDVISLPLNQKAAQTWHKYLRLLRLAGYLPHKYYEKMDPNHEPIPEGY